MAKQSATQIETRDSRLVHAEQQTDAPNLPALSLQRLHEFRPDLVDEVIHMTKSEAEHRRKLEIEEHQTNIKLAKRGQVFALIIALLGISAAMYMQKNGAGASTIIAVFGGSFAVIVLAFLKRK